jgi:hypothetical protein
MIALFPISRERSCRFVLFGLVVMTSFCSIPDELAAEVQGSDQRCLVQELFCPDSDSAETSPEWRLIVFMDVHACLTCTEDMDAWRQLRDTLAANDGIVSLWALREDSADVYWAMKLEGISSWVRVLSQRDLRKLSWDKLSTPVKMLLDRSCKEVDKGGRMVDVEASRRFMRRLMQHVSHGGEQSSGGE